jgi:hypothetical protein
VARQQRSLSTRAVFTQRHDQWRAPAQVDGGEKGVLNVDGAADAAVLRVGGGCSKATDVMWGGGEEHVAAAEMVGSWLRWN